MMRPRMIQDTRGYAVVWGLLLTSLFILMAGAVYDVYMAYHYRTWGYEVVSEAARRGVIEGAEWPPQNFYFTGELHLQPNEASTKAASFLKDALSRRGITDYSYDIRVLPTGGGTVPNFPPVLRAAQDGQYMHLNGPGVGVYLEFSYPTVWLGVLSRGEYRIHVFAAAEMREVVGP